MKSIYTSYLVCDLESYAHMTYSNNSLVPSPIPMYDVIVEQFLKPQIVHVTMQQDVSSVFICLLI